MPPPISPTSQSHPVLVEPTPWHWAGPALANRARPSHPSHSVWVGPATLPSALAGTGKALRIPVAGLCAWQGPEHQSRRTLCQVARLGGETCDAGSRQVCWQPERSQGCPASDSCPGWPGWPAEGQKHHQGQVGGCKIEATAITLGE